MREHCGTLGQVTSSVLTFPPQWVQDEKKKKKRNIKTRVSKPAVLWKGHSENLQWIFLCTVSIVDFLPTTSKDWFLTNPFLLSPPSYSQLSSTVGVGPTLLPRLKVKGHFCGCLPPVQEENLFLQDAWSWRWAGTWPRSPPSPDFTQGAIVMPKSCYCIS